MSRLKNGNSAINKILIDQAGLGTLILDENLEIVDCNDGLINIVGLPKDSITGTHWDDLIIYDYPYTPIQNKPSPDYNGPVPSGKFWCALKSKMPKKILSGTISFSRSDAHYYATLYDISEQTAPERLINDGGLLFSAIVENMKGAMGFHDSHGILRYASNEICNLIGSEKSEILGHHINEFFDEDIVKDWLLMMKERPEKIPPSLEFNSSRQKEKVFHVIATPKLLMDLNGKVVGCMFICTDITELKLNEQKLRISDEKYSKAFQASPALSCITTLAEGRYLDANESYLSFVGYTKEELKEKTSTDINFFVDKEYRLKFVDELRLKGKLRDMETLVYSRSKGIRTMSLSAEIIVLQGEQCLIWLANDITDVIRLEKEVLTVTDRERYKIGLYLHDDLAQHLVGVEAMCALLEKRLKKQDNPEAALAGEINEYLREAHEKTRGMARGLCPVRLEERGLSSAIIDLTVKIEKMFGVSCGFYNFNTSDRIYNSQISINMFYIVQEAVNNAVRHGSADDIKITYSSNENNMYLCVEDNGTGFDINRDYQNGMGMNLMKYRARAIGGHLEIFSAPGTGTLVRLKFPRINNKKSELDWEEACYEKITDIHS